MKTSVDANVTLWEAFPKWKIDLWDQNVVNGKYIIAYEFNPDLDPKLQTMLPQVYNIS